jgi:hypothetical protein
MSYAVKYLPNRLKVTLRIVGLPPSDPVILVKPPAATHSAELLVDMQSCRYNKSINLYHFYNSYTKGRPVFPGVATSGDVLDLLYVEGYDEPLGTLLHTMDNRAIERLGQPWAKDLETLIKLFPKGRRVMVRYKGIAKLGQFHPNGHFSYIGGNLDTVGLSPTAFVEAAIGTAAGREIESPFDHIFVQIDPEHNLDQSLSAYLQEHQKVKDNTAPLMNFVDSYSAVVDQLLATAATAAAAATATTVTVSVTQEQRDNEKRDLRGLLDSPMTVQVRGSKDGCSGAISGTLEIDGTFSYCDCDEVLHMDLHSSELVQHFNYTPAMGGAVLPINPETSLSHIFFYRDCEKTLADRVEEMYDEMPPLVSIAEISSTPSPSSSGITQATQSPQSLLAVAKARTQELQGEIELFQQIVAQKNINKGLEQELERIKASVV